MYIFRITQVCVTQVCVTQVCVIYKILETSYIITEKDINLMFVLVLERRKLFFTHCPKHLKKTEKTTADEKKLYLCCRKRVLFGRKTHFLL